jgi:hypothetical protein
MRRIAPPFVATFALACSSKPAPVVAVSDPAPSASTTASAAPPETAPVAIYADSGVCRAAPSAEIVDCPKAGPTLIRSDKTHVQVDGGNIFISDGSFTCRKTFGTAGCPPGAICNPPPPQDVDCPAALLPHLAPGVKPTKQNGDKCMLGEIKVTCP